MSLKKLSLVILIILVGCQANKEERYFDRATKAFKNNKVNESIKNLNLIIKVSPNHPKAMEAALLGVKISEGYSPTEFLSFARYIVDHSSREEQRIHYQKKVIQALLDKQLYLDTIKEINKLLFLPRGVDNYSELKLNLAKCYYHLNNYSQAKIEVKGALEKTKDKEIQFQAEILLADMMVLEEQQEQAAEKYEEIMQNFPQRAQKNQVAMKLAMVYEEMENFSRSIEILESLKENSQGKDFVDDKIERLKRRQSFLPGAKGLKK